MCRHILSQFGEKLDPTEDTKHRAMGNEPHHTGMDRTGQDIL